MLKKFSSWINVWPIKEQQHLELIDSFRRTKAKNERRLKSLNRNDKYFVDTAWVRHLLCQVGEEDVKVIVTNYQLLRERR